jgi:diaminopropionate ammonia-lyase
MTTLIRNTCRKYATPIPADLAGLFRYDTPDIVFRYFSKLTDYRPTPLLSLGGLANALGVGKIFYKDEGHRFGQQSFKALGGAYAVTRLIHKLVEESLGREVGVEDLQDQNMNASVKDFRVACATDGNHGRSVAWGAHLLGCPCTIFLPGHVSGTREQVIRALGADIVRVPGVYDDAVAEAARVAERSGWQIVSDFATSANNEITAYVMQGYTLMAHEIATELGRLGETFSHLFIQGGCGGLAASMVAYFAGIMNPRPTFVTVEPERANCLLQSAQQDRLSKIDVSGPTCMGLLECFEPSHMAWPVIESTVDYFMEISDETAVEASRRLLMPSSGDPVIRTSPSGVAGLAGLVSVHRRQDVYEMLGLDENSSVLIIGSEGDVEHQQRRLLAREFGGG